MSAQETENLSGIDLLEGLDAGALKKLEEACSFRRYTAQEQIIDRQSDSTDVFFIISGDVRVVNYSLSGREIALDDMPAGAYFGELAALDGQPRSASVMALSDCLVAALPQEQFLGLLEHNAPIALKAMKSLARVVRTSTDRIMDLSTLAANNRVQADLLRLAKACMSEGNTAEISPIPMHSDIASRASTTRETVARVLNDLARRDVVERQKETLVVLDVEQLSDMVEEVRGE
ncbi:MAG: Crp/Fnr family transcriptional regulator [Alphaproteobacteria bacterium]|nr:Crp/Fnr family transcriptional regulator [Alphaproteobacteria bacterium]